MLTYIDVFNEDEIIKAARGYIAAYSSKGNIDEVSIPFKKHGGNQVRYVQFALLAGQWLFVRFK